MKPVRDKLSQLVISPQLANVLSALALLVAIISWWTALKSLRVASAPNVQVVEAKFIGVTSLDSRRYTFSLADLPVQQLPSKALARLSVLESKTFYSAEDLSRAVERCLGQEDAVKYSSAILEHIPGQPISYLEIAVDVRNFGSAPALLTGVTWSAAVTGDPIQPKGIWIANDGIPPSIRAVEEFAFGGPTWRSGAWAYSTSDSSLMSALKKRTVGPGQERRLLLRLDTGDRSVWNIPCRVLEVGIQVRFSNGVSLSVAPECMPGWIGG